jgi:hypothetical protein
MAETGGVASGGGQHDHSNLEVVPTHDYSNVGANKNDKIAFVPCRDHDKLVVPPNLTTPPTTIKGIKALGPRQQQSAGAIMSEDREET